MTAAVRIFSIFRKKPKARDIRKLYSIAEILYTDRLPLEWRYRDTPRAGVDDGRRCVRELQCEFVEELETEGTPWDRKKTAVQRIRVLDNPYHDNSRSSYARRPLVFEREDLNRVLFEDIEKARKSVQWYANQKINEHVAAIQRIQEEVHGERADLDERIRPKPYLDRSVRMALAGALIRHVSSAEAYSAAPAYARPL